MAKLPAPKVPGLVKGLGVTLKTMGRTMFPARGIKTLIPAPSKGAATVQYPHEKEVPSPRARGVIALGGQLHRLHAVRPQLPRLHLHRGHKETAPPAAPGQAADGQQARPVRHRLRPLRVLGICVEVCPFSPCSEPQYEIELRLADLLRDGALGSGCGPCPLEP